MRYLYQLIFGVKLRDELVFLGVYVCDGDVEAAGGHLVGVGGQGCPEELLQRAQQAVLGSHRTKDLLVRRRGQVIRELDALLKNKK